MHTDHATVLFEHLQLVSLPAAQVLPLGEVTGAAREAAAQSRSSLVAWFYD